MADDGAPRTESHPRAEARASWLSSTSQEGPTPGLTGPLLRCLIASAVAIVRITDDQIEPMKATTLGEEGILEREDLQRLLKKNIKAIDSDLYVISEEFRNWNESKRRIDLLALDRDANLVVIELKRDGSGHMELQALRYAAMVSAMTFDQVVWTHEQYLEKEGIDKDARDEVLSFLQWEDEGGDPAIGDVRIILVSGGFSKELTTAVLWLIERGLDIRCVRLKPYRVDELLLADIQQILPLREAQDYIIQIGKKRRAQQDQAKREPTLRAFWAGLPIEFHQVAHGILDSIEPKVSHLRPGTGSCAPVLEIGGVQHLLFRVRTDGSIRVLFSQLAKCPPFSDRVLRRALLEKVNEIEGVTLRAENLEGKPAIPLRLFEKPESLARFCEVVEWWIEQVETTAE